MKYISPTQSTHRTIERLRQELDAIENMVDYWEAEHKNIAFGELGDYDTIGFGYKEWAAIYESKGWTEDLFNLCYFNPVSFNIQKETVIKTGLFGKKVVKHNEEAPTQWANYEHDQALRDIWFKWQQYHHLWNFRLNKLEMARFDLRRVKQTPEISIEEALFICLGLSPAVIGDIGFTKNGWYHNFDTKLKDTIGHSKFTLEDKNFKLIFGDVEYHDIYENELTLKLGIYDDDGYGMMELALRKTEEYHLIDSNQQLKSENGLILTKPFLKWAYKHKYLREYEIKERNKNDSPYGEKFARELYDHLIRDGIIHGNFDDMWTWYEAFGWNSLHYLADEIKKMDLTPNKIPYQFQAIQKYIDYTGKAPLNQQYEEAVTEYDKKRWVEKSELIASCLTKLELKLQDNPPKRD
jgi:hypothetical protein